MKLVITVDVGASLTKIIYRLWKSSKECQTSYICMSPLIEEINKEKLKQYLESKGWLGAPVPEEEAYLEVGDEYFVVGDLAKEFDASDRTFERKYENALYKVLAGIGVVLETSLVKTKKEMTTWISVLLPWDEYSDRFRFTEHLVKLLANYKFRGETVRVKATKETVLVMPEGGGIASAYVLKKGGSYLKGKRIGIAMFGHQNLTGLLLNNGKLVYGDSPKMGFTWFLDRVIRNTSGLDREKLSKAINECLNKIKIDSSTPFTVEGSYTSTDFGGDYSLGLTGSPNYGECLAVKCLATSRKESLRSSEIKHISNQILKAQLEYFEKVEKWLSKIFPVKEIDYLLFSGGAVNFFKQQLERYCNSYRRITRDSNFINKDYKFTEIEGESEYKGLSDPYIELISDRSLASKVSEVLGLSQREIEELSLSTRFVDALGIFEYHLEIEKKYQQKKKKGSISLQQRGAEALKNA